MTIHFICTGNIYRSRLAEAYCASKRVTGLRVLSSGIGTKLNRGFLIASYAARVLSERGIERFAAPSWQQTTTALVRASDVLVFMEPEHYSFCKDWIDPVRQTGRDMGYFGCGAGGCGADHDQGRANLRDDQAADGCTPVSKTPAQAQRRFPAPLSPPWW